jgi:hypothetical protein
MNVGAKKARPEKGRVAVADTVEDGGDGRHEPCG